MARSLYSHPIFCAVTLLLILGSSLAFAAPAPSVATPTEADPTSTDVLLLALYVSLALFFSFLCSVAEAALLSITPSFIAEMRESRPKHAAILKKLKEDDIDRSLAAILTVNTIAHTVGAIGAGAKATVVFGSAWFGAFSAVMTLLILFFSEIIPKTLGAVYWRQLTRFTALYVNFLTFAMYPLVLVSEMLTKVITRGKKVHVFTRDEFVAMANVGRESGHINDRESRIIRNLLRTESLKAADIMTPRIVLSALAEASSINEAIDFLRGSRFSRLPIYSSSIDNVTGFVLKSELLQAKSENRGESKLVEFRRDILAIPTSTKLLAMLESFLARQQHIALVVGEYGETEGVVTLEDVMETLLGVEIVDEVDKVVDMQALARDLWKKRAKGLGLNIGQSKTDLEKGSTQDSPPSSQ